MLFFGVIYLGQYQNSIIEAELKNFERETEIISLAIGALDLKSEKAEEKILQITQASNQAIKIFDQNGTMLLYEKAPIKTQNKAKELKSIKLLKNTASLITSLLPDTQNIPYYPAVIDPNTNETPDLIEALSGLLSLSAWHDKNDEIILSAGAPIIKNGETIGALILIREGQDIKNEIAQVWKSILRIFIATLCITIILSIYLAGAIANPLKKLANAAEAVRTGRAKGEDIPDLSHRFDEIGDLSVALRSMTDALWEKMDSIENFSADVAHELKNPLTSLKSAIETLPRVAKKSDQEKLISIINHDVERMDRLITDISAASRLDAELSRETFNVINAENMMFDILDFYKDPAHREDASHHHENKFQTQNNIQIKININAQHKFLIKGSQIRLKQVFHNLIDNALSFSKPNNIVAITINRGENLVAIRIDDEGPGIPNNKLETIFDRFYTERPEESYGQHSGLGLSICKQIIDSHRGEIFAENRHDNNGNIIGARFSVILRATQEDKSV